MRLIDADALKRQINDKTHFLNYEDADKKDVIDMLDETPTIIPEELKPLIDKVVEILPDLTNAIIEQLPQIISSLIKCSECSYYKDTWNVIPTTHGEWIFDKDFTEFGNPYGTYKCSVCGGHSSNKYSFCKDCGAKMDADDDPPMEYYENGGI